MKLALTKSVLAALVIEVLVIAILVAIVANKPAKAQEPEQAVMLTFPEPVAKPETPPEKEKQVPPPKPVQPKVSQPKPKEDKEPDPLPKIVDAKPAAEAAPVSLPAKPVEPPRLDASVSDSFKGSVRAAVQAAVVYPPSARMTHIVGRAKVAFNYQDGRVSNLSIVTSSGFNTLDAAAQRAVEAASYPAPPAEFVGKPLHFEVWVRFFLNESAED